ncbi:MAG TPA: PDZ domain-containing protein [Planctomycetota bacterium]|nr:PDZ domain-containing protein [Planctomycetota bacterium]
MGRRVLGLLTFALLLTSGCSTLFKDDYWDTIKEQSDRDEVARIRDDPTSAFFLGVRVKSDEGPNPTGIKLQHVYAEGPAAKAGLREGDEIRKIDRYFVNTNGEARWVLSTLWKDREEEELRRRRDLVPGEKTVPLEYAPLWEAKVVYARDGQEIEATVPLSSHEGFLEKRRERVLGFSRYEQSGYNGWGLSRVRTVPKDLVWSYFGVRVDEDVVVASDTDILPLAFGISIFRYEDVPVAFATRVTVICSLLQFSKRGDDVARTLSGLIPDPPEGTTDL